MFGLNHLEAVEFFSILFLAIVLALQAYARKKKPDPVYEIECPNKIHELAATMREIKSSLARIEAGSSEQRELAPKIRDLASLYMARDEDGIPRGYSRDQGRKILGLLARLLEDVEELEKELEIRNRLNGNGGRGGPGR